MAAQDDIREREMRTLFNLETAPDRRRADIDAILKLEGTSIPPELSGTTVPFELKSATGGKPTISTVRDFGLSHVEKWRPLHWLFGIYGRGVDGDLQLQYCLYGSPAKMAPWFDRMADYIAPDVMLALHVPELITMATLSAVLGDATDFSLREARQLMKNQYSAAQYERAADEPEQHYSRVAMLAMLRERCRYVIERGSTLNNPHIPASHFAGWEQIERNHAARLRELVVEALLREQ
ncbi:MAG TPA: hypothetical protein VGG41_12925 [Solirubrobacteraceae bacterium]